MGFISSLDNKFPDSARVNSFLRIVFAMRDSAETQFSGKNRISVLMDIFAFIQDCDCEPWPYARSEYKSDVPRRFYYLFLLLINTFRLVKIFPNLKKTAMFWKLTRIFTYSSLKKLIRKIFNSIYPSLKTSRAPDIPKRAHVIWFEKL